MNAPAAVKPKPTNINAFSSSAQNPTYMSNNNGSPLQKQVPHSNYENVDYVNQLS